MSRRPITVYCAFCLRPKAGQQKKVKQMTETCVREATARHVAVAPTGTSYWLLDPSEMRCSTWWETP